VGHFVNIVHARNEVPHGGLFFVDYFWFGVVVRGGLFLY
jgi:hypothetical protein